MSAPSRADHCELICSVAFLLLHPQRLRIPVFIHLAHLGTNGDGSMDGNIPQTGQIRVPFQELNLYLFSGQELLGMIE